MAGWWKRSRGPARVEVYEDAAGRWRWRSVAKNGKIVAATEQGYATKYYAMTKAEQYAADLGITPEYVQS